MENAPRPLSAKEKKVLQFIEEFIGDQGLAPSYRKIKEHFGFASFNSVQNYIKQLQKKNYIYVPGDNQKRAITLLHPSCSTPHFINNLKDPNGAPSMQRNETPPGPPTTAESLTIPLLGRVAAGLPMEALDHDEYVDVPLSLIKNNQRCFALKVEGESMIEEGIFNNDTVIVKEQSTASNGELVIAVVDNEATLKRIHLHNEKIELRPSNSNMESMWFPSTEVSVKGKVISLLRSYL